ncbi:MAG: hypothetical protein AAGU05_10225 [Anaerolineaceae bacterium]
MGLEVPGIFETEYELPGTSKLTEKIVVFVGLIVVLAFILPGFDRRWG